MDRQEQALRCQLDHADKMIAMAAEIKSREAELLLTIQGGAPPPRRRHAHHPRAQHASARRSSSVALGARARAAAAPSIARASRESSPAVGSVPQVPGGRRRGEGHQGPPRRRHLEAL
eukprot:2730807-Prymnesium_polylepis.1